MAVLNRFEYFKIKKYFCIENLRICRIFYKSTNANIQLKNKTDLFKEMLQATLKKKKECNAKALEIVEKLCETHVDEEWFLANLQYINQTHFVDATVERAITKICGYPLCTQTLEKVPAQQYHISTRYNKVFDITERKNFCSSCCYKSAMYVKKQLFTSPLWFRDQETIPEYLLLKTSKSSLGEEVVFLPDKIKPEPEDLKRRNSPKTMANKSIAELEEKCSNLKIQGVDSKEEILNKVDVKSAENLTVQGVINNENNENGNLIENNFKNSNCEKEIHKSEDLERLQESKKESNALLKDGNNSGIKKNRKTITNEQIDVITKIEKSIIEWFSLDTFFYLYDEDKLKELLSDEASRIKEVLNSKLAVAGHSEKIDRMIKLYGLLDSNCFSNNNTKMNLKPLPDYSALKEQGKSLEIKVRAFYQGQLEIKANDKNDEKNEEKKEEIESDASPIYMPLVDAHAQTALRRKIVLDKLNKLLPDIIRVFSSDYILQMREVRNLVATFSLSARNISFKPTEWYLIGIFIIKLLSIKDKYLESIINEDSSKNQILLILMSYGLQKNYLDDLIDRINDISILMKKLNEINKQF